MHEREGMMRTSLPVIPRLVATLLAAAALALILALAGTTITMAQSPPSITLTRLAAPVATPVEIFGNGFVDGPAEVRLNNETIKTVTIRGGSFKDSLMVSEKTAPGLVTIRVCPVNFCSQPPGANDATSPFRVLPSLADVPAELRQRALRFLEEARDSTPEWKDAGLELVVLPHLRPDLEEVAYYEFAVGVPIEGLQATAPAGFIILSTGPHDYPIAHWDSQGVGPGVEILRNSQQTVHTIYKLDALFYAGENARGEQAAFIGQQPPRLVGLEETLAAGTPLNGQAAWTPTQSFQDDSAGTPSTGTISATGAISIPTTLKLESWNSWNDLKSGYATNYARLLDALERNASHDWQVEQSLTRDGVALRKGETYILAYLPGGTPALTGPGAALVQSRSLADTRLEITATDAQPGASVPFSVTISYASGSETVRFAVIDGLRSLVYVPLVSTNAPRQATPATPAPVAPVAAPAAAPAAELQTFGPWRTWSAGTDADQRLYRQLRPGESPNTKSCYSGCGATAWAMLFGWVDVRAHAGDPNWSGRTGIYRTGGGRSPASSTTIAPRSNDAGVGAMTWEIHRAIGTFCVLENGPTWPGDMIGAGSYLTGRTSGRLRTDWNFPGIGNKWENVRRSIVDRRTPAIMGTGFFGHYPLAYKYREQSRRVQRCILFVCWGETQYNRQFYVNQGWEGSGNGWVPADSWFIGEIFRN